MSPAELAGLRHRAINGDKAALKQWLDLPKAPKAEAPKEPEKQDPAEPEKPAEPVKEKPKKGKKD